MVALGDSFECIGLIHPGDQGDPDKKTKFLANLLSSFEEMLPKRRPR
jgi:hypothetical protein